MLLCFSVIHGQICARLLDVLCYHLDIFFILLFVIDETLGVLQFKRLYSYHIVLYNSYSQAFKAF